MNRYFAAICCSLLGFSAFAQNSVEFDEEGYSLEDYDWASEATMVTDTNIRKLDDAYVLYNRSLQFAYEGEESVLYELIHRKIWVGNEKVIQRYNKIYLPVYEEDAQKTIKARVILPDGNVNELDEDDIEKGKDEDGDEYSYFALNGVTEGCVVEYLFLNKVRPSYMGTRITLQRETPIFNLTFQLIAPDNLLFKLKSYNALNQPQRDTVLTEQNRWFILQDTLEKFESEPNAYERANMGYVVFALDRNLYSGKRDISSFGYTSANIYKNVTVEPSRYAQKQFKKIVEASGMEDEQTDELKLARLENYLKQNFFVAQQGGSELYNLDDILEFKKMSELGALRLYTTLFPYAGFPVEMVFTTDKSSTPFDPEFESNLLISENLLYFPDQEVFMMPTNLVSRVDYFSEDYRNQPGLFVYGVELGDEKEGIGEVRDIPSMPAEKSKAILEIDWHLSADDLGKIDMKREMWGNQTNYMQLIAPFVPEEEMEEFEKDILSWMYGEVDMQDYKVENLNPESFPGKPLLISANFTDEVYTEPGSNQTIVKVGEIIGRQSELYLTDSVRNFPVHHGFPKYYHRKIKLHVPEGYVLQNVESLNMHVVDDEENTQMYFDCSYTYENNVLQIDVIEWYEGGDYPKELFEVYRSVINAAADFNKKYLVLEPAKP